MADNIGSITEPSVLIEATPAVLSYLEKKENLKSLHKKITDIKKLSSADLKEIVKAMHGDSAGRELRGQDLDLALEEMFKKGEKFTSEGKEPYLHELLQGAQMHLPENPIIERNPELAARVERLRLQQEERAYQSMTKGISAGKFIKEDTIAYQVNMMNRQLIAVGQVILSVAAGFAFGFLGIPLIVGGMEFGVRILLGLFVAGIIAIAELYFLAKYMSAEDSAQDQNPTPNISASPRPHQD